MVNFLITTSLAFSNIGEIYVKPRIADTERVNPISKIIKGSRKTKIKQTKGVVMCTTLSLPKKIAIKESEDIIQALIMELERPDNSAKHQITAKERTIFIFLGRKKSSLFTAITSIVML